MPFYELVCERCHIYFEVNTQIDIDVDDLFCVDCGSSRVKIQRYNKTLGTRLENLTSDIRELRDRMERVEDLVIEGVMENARLDGIDGDSSKN